MYPDYTPRLEAVTKMARHFPGIRLSRRKRDSTLSEEVGLFAGIYIQTRWQQQSGRHKLLIWHLVNESLTLIPYKYYLEYTKGQNNVQTPVHETQLRHAWEQYFYLADRVLTLERSNLFSEGFKAWLLARIVLPRKLWSAHMLSMRSALSHHKELFMTAEVPAEERGFWRGWVRFVLASGRLGVPTTEFVLGRFLQAIMPTHGPLTEESMAQKPESRLCRVCIRVLIFVGRNEQRFFAQLK